MTQIDTEHFVMPMGKYAGTRVQRIPRSYLEWMVQVRHDLAGVAKAELDRRGSKVPEMDLSPHAVDRASQRLLSRWYKDCKASGEGLHSWLSRKAREAYELILDGSDTIVYEGVKYVFQADGAFPSLKSVMIASSHKQKSKAKVKRRRWHVCPLCKSKS